MEEEFNLRAAQERMQEEIKKLLGQLNEWIGKTNAENAFVSFAAFLVGQWIAERECGGSVSPRTALVEFAAFYLYPHFGNTPTRDTPAVASVIGLLEKLKNNSTGGLIVSGDKDIDVKLASIANHVRLYVEDVRGTGYITQIREQIECIQAPFEDRFRNLVGIGPKRAVELLYAIQRQLTENFWGARESAYQSMVASEEAFSGAINASTENQEEQKDAAKSLAIAEAISTIVADRFPVAREQLSALPNLPTTEEWAGLIRLIGLTTDFRRSLTEVIGVKSRPLFVMPDNRLLFVDLSSVLDELFSAYERVAKQDQVFFSGKYHKNQMIWMEGKVAEFLKRIFPAKHVFVGVDYPDPEKAGGTAEMDAVAEWGPFLILVEAKGKQFRLREALQDLGRLLTDLKKNVQDAFEQAERAMRFVYSNSHPIFKERKTGRQLEVSRTRLRRIFKMSVTLQHLADFATQLANLKVLNLFQKDDYPFSVSLADLDIITQFCESPDVFLHYIERRLELQQSGKNIMGDELNLFGTYLDTRLQPSLIWERKSDDGKPFDTIWIGDGCEKFDAWHDAKIGLRKDVPKIELVLPQRVKSLLAELRNRKDDGSRWIAFSLLGLSQRGMARLDRLLDQISNLDVAAGKLRSSVFEDEGLIGVITAGRLTDAQHLRETLHARVTIEKYRRKANAAFGFAIELNNPYKPFDFALWGEGKWLYEPEMERVLKLMPPPQIRPGMRVPKPDEVCICGSEKEFQNCCLPSLEN